MRLSTRDRRAVIILAVAAVLFAVVDFGLLPAVDRLAEARKGLPVEELTLRKYRRAAASAAARENSLADLQKRVAAVEAGMLESETSALAVAELQRTVKELAAVNQVDLTGTDFLPPRPLDPGHTLVSIRFAVTANTERLVSFLAALETAPKALAVRTLTVIPIGGSPDKRLNLTLAVSGLMRAEKVAEKEKKKG